MPVQAVGSPEASPGGSWETIPAGGKGRRSSTGGPRKTPPPQPPAGEHGAHGHAAAAAAHQHKQAAPVQHQQHDSLASGHQARQHVRAVPVCATPVPHARVSLPYVCFSPYLNVSESVITSSFIFYPSFQSRVASVSSGPSLLFCLLLAMEPG